MVWKSIIFTFSLIKYWSHDCDFITKIFVILIYFINDHSLVLVYLLHLVTEIISLSISELKKVKKEFKAYQYVQ